jgi:thiol-disulfide isomerase/thioredoxin
VITDVNIALIKMKNKTCGIYKITSPSNRVYIGQSININKRWRSYLNMQNGNSKQHLINKSFLKYGVENHIFEIVEECLEEDLNCRERYWQDFYDVLNGGLNLVLQECGEKRRILSEETIERKRKASLGEKNAMYGKESPFKGKRHSDETKKQSSNRMKGKYLGENNPFFGKTHTEEVKIKISDIAKSRVKDKNPFFGKKHTDEYKEISSKRTSEYFKNNPEAKEHLKNILSRGTYFTPNGEFISQKDAAKANNVSKSTILNRCIKKANNKVGFNKQIPEELRGEHTWREIGWYFKSKKEIDMITIIDFYSPNCAPCQFIKKELESFNNVEYVNVMDDFEKALEFQIRKSPTLIFLKNGEEKQRTVGFKTKQEIEEIINTI